MINLININSKIRVITSAAGDIEVHASYVDLSGATVTPSSDNPASILTAGTTDIVAAPAASTVRNVKTLSLFNNHATVVNTLTVTHSNGTNESVLIRPILQPYESITFVEGIGWQKFSSGVPITVNNPNPTNIQTFSTGTGGTWVKPTDFTPKIVIVEMLGAGGGGGAGVEVRSKIFRS